MKKPTMDLYFSKEQANAPYLNDRELERDLLALLDIHLEIAYLEKFGNPPDLENVFMRGMVISQAEVEGLLFRTEFPSKKTKTLPSLKKAWQHVTGRLRKSTGLQMNALLQTFAFSEFAFFCFLAAYASALDRKYERIFGYLQDSLTERHPTVGTAIFLYSFYKPVYNDEMLQVLHHPTWSKLLLGTPAEGIHSTFATPLLLPYTLFTFLQKGKGLSSSMAEFCTLVEDGNTKNSIFVLQKQFDRMSDAISQAMGEKNHLLVQLFGPEGIGKTYGLSYLAEHGKGRFLVVDGEKLLRMEEPKQKKLQVEIWLQSVLFSRIPFFKHIPTGEDVQLQVQTWVTYLTKHCKILFFSQEEKILYNYDSTVRVLQIPLDMPGVEDRLRLWQTFSKERGIQADLAALANKYILSPKQIQGVLHTAELLAVQEGALCVTETHLIAAIHNQNARRMKNLATPVKLVYQWNDLLAEPEQKRMMTFALNHVKYRHKVIDEWGFNQKLAYGRGLSILFYGPPGTGKTMAAQVMAKELGLELFRVDLSQMISKYIGETEKNLSTLFNEAKYSNSILFFDEADALFAKRTEVSDSKDRNANVETSYLLQKMEDHEGLSILATNYLTNFDDAFKRRISFIVNFSLPGKEMRLQLWQQMIPPSAPVGILDYEFLANTFELSGSNIKNIVVGAAYMAAAEDSPITMKQIVTAIKIENAKTGKVLLRHEFGRYSEFF